MAQPVSRFHDGTSFWVEVDGNRHSRADTKSLRVLLNASADSATSSSALSPKDKPTHFYIAQLKHYGLKHLKTKRPAKAALSEALNQKPKLAVPANILQIENSLKEGYLRISGASGARNPPSKKRKMDQRNEGTPPPIVAPVVKPSQPDPKPNQAPAQAPPAARITRSQKELVDKMVDLPRSHLHKVLVDLIKQNPGLEEKIREKIANKRIKTAGTAPSTSNDKKFHDVQSESWDSDVQMRDDFDPYDSHYDY
ncbi:hypothetical protein L208DRAFT_1396684 [Tricholoma matsutake]|nr:hypothetical protein L208DRAFT_1396684 [Tricholoma matsutake 945]